MKKSTMLLALGASGALLQAAEQNKGPMDAQWFYDKNNPYNKANELHQERDWQGAENTYKKLLAEGSGDDYDQENARLNLAACSWAQDKPSRGWASFDTLLGIEKGQQISKEL